MPAAIYANRVSRTRFSTATDASGLLDMGPERTEHDGEDGPAQKMDAETEKSWQQFSMDENIKLGSHALLIWTVVVLCFRTSTYINMTECTATSLSNGEIVTTRVLEYGFLILSCIPLLLCLQTPRTKMYLTVVCLHFIYLLLVQLPPFTASCQDLLYLYEKVAKKTCVDSLESVAYREAVTLHLDCTLQGHTSQQMCMTFLLISPRIIPRRGMMILLWVWIFVFYLGTTVWYSSRHGREDSQVESNNSNWLFRDRYFSDADIMFSLLFLSVALFIAIQKKYYLDKSQQNKYLYDAKHKKASEKMFNILHVMVPVHVIGRMLGNSEVIADEVNRASILFIMICDFENHIHRYSDAKGLLGFLNEQFTTMDTICAAEGVTKIETVGEEYVAAVGVIPDDVRISEEEGHDVILGRLIKAASDILRCQQEEPYEVKFKMGMHTGAVVAGVIGQKLPRFRLFGDTINTSARMMQKGLPGELQFGEDTKDNLPDWVKTRHRGPIEMKGKGMVETYFLDKSEEVNKPKAKGVAFAADLESRSSSSDIPARKKSFVQNLLVTHAEASAEADDLDVQTNDERKRRSGDFQSSQEPARVRADRAWSPQTEVELTAVTKDDMERGERLRDPLLDSNGDGRPRRREVSDTCEAPDDATYDVPERQPKAETPKRPRLTTRSLGRADTLKSTFSVRGRTVDVEDSDEASGPSTEDVEKKLQFEKVLEDINSDDMAKGNWRSKLLTLGIDKQGFNKEMEQNWYKWYHENAICKKLDSRLDKQALALSFLTVVDTVTMVWMKIAPQDYHLGTSFRFPIFLCARFTAFFIMISWRLTAGTAPEYVENHPKEVQMRVLGSYIAIAALVFLSYDSMTVMWQQKAFRMWEEDDPHGAHREAGFYSLLCVPVYFIIITQFQLLFIPSCFFIFLSTGLMCLNWLPGWSNMFFSHQGKALFILNSIMNAYLALEAENTSRARFKAKHAMDFTKDRIEVILNTLMPPNVVLEIQTIQERDGPKAAPPSHVYKTAIIAQSDLCGFTKLAATRTPTEVVKFIGELFGSFDDLTDKYDIYKVETIGDAYIAGQAEHTLTDTHKPLQVVLFGLDMVRKTNEWSRGMGETVSCRVGIAHGECIGGIVGTEMQRYHLFGGLMTELEILESTAPEAKVQVSQAMKLACEAQMKIDKIPPEAMMFEARTEPQLKTSKGEKHDYSEVGGVTYTVKTYPHLRSLIK